MHLILLRHADKDFRQEGDPGLSQRGLQQARSLPEVLANTDENAWPLPTVLWCSPKKRTQATLAPLSEILQIPIHVEPALDERSSSEPFIKFRERLRTLLLNFEDKPDSCAVWCTHLDCLDEFRTILGSEVDLSAGAFLDWGPADFVVIKLQDLWQFVDSGGSP